MPSPGVQRGDIGLGRARGGRAGMGDSPGPDRDLAEAIASAIESGSAGNVSGGTTGTAAVQDTTGGGSASESAGTAAPVVSQGFVSTGYQPSAGGFQTHEEMYPGHRLAAKQAGAGGLLGLITGKNKNFVANNKSQMKAMGITPSHKDSKGNLTGKYSSGDWKAFQAALATGGTMATEEDDYGAWSSGMDQAQDLGQGLISQGQMTGYPNQQGIYRPAGTMATEEFDSPTPLAGTPSQVAMGTGRADPNRIIGRYGATMEESQMGMAEPLGTGGNVGAFIEESQMGMSPPLGLGNMISPEERVMGIAEPLGTGGNVGAYIEESQMGMAHPLGTGTGVDLGAYTEESQMGIAPPLGTGTGVDLGTYVEEQQMGVSPPLGANRFYPGMQEEMDARRSQEADAIAAEQAAMWANEFAGTTAAPSPSPSDVFANTLAGDNLIVGASLGGVTGAIVDDDTVTMEEAVETAQKTVNQTTAPADPQEKVVAVIEEVSSKPQLYGAQEYQALAQDRLAVLDRLRANPNGTTHGVNNRTLANAYAGFDSTLKAYAAVNGTSQLASIIGSLIPGMNLISGALRSFENALINRGIFDRSSGDQILREVAARIQSGEPLNEAGGPEQVSMTVDQFVLQYPWASELDPGYIQYLINNPAELQSLIGQA